MWMGVDGCGWVWMAQRELGGDAAQEDHEPGLLHGMHSPYCLFSRCSLPSPPPRSASHGRAFTLLVSGPGWGGEAGGWGGRGGGWERGLCFSATGLRRRQGALHNR